MLPPPSLTLSSSHLTFSLTSCFFLISLASGLFALTLNQKIRKERRKSRRGAKVHKVQSTSVGLHTTESTRIPQYFFFLGPLFFLAFLFLGSFLNSCSCRTRNKEQGTKGDTNGSRIDTWHGESPPASFFFWWQLWCLCSSETGPTTLTGEERREHASFHVHDRKSAYNEQVRFA